MFGTFTQASYVQIQCERRIKLPRVDDGFPLLSNVERYAVYRYLFKGGMSWLWYLDF